MKNETDSASAGAAAMIETAELIDIIWGKLMSWLQGFVEMLPNLVVAVLVLIFFSLVSRIAHRFVRRIFERTSSNAQLSRLAATTARLSFLSLGLFLALSVLQLEKTVTSLLAGVGVVGLALGFAFQDIASNFMSGLILALRRPFEIGEMVETGGVDGNVEEVNLRATVIRNYSGQRVIIPNKDVLQNAIINYTRSGERRVEIPVGVGYASDLERVRSTARDAIHDLPGLNTSRDVDVIYTGFGESSIDLEVRFWLDLHEDQASYLEARSQGIMAIKKAFDADGINIPFPIRTLDLPSGFVDAVSGETAPDEA